MDYRLVDAVTEPPDQPSFGSQSVIRLPGCFCCYRPDDDAPGVTPSPAAASGELTFGVPHKPPKINPQTVALWVRVVQAAPGSRILDYRHDFSQHTVTLAGASHAGRMTASVLSDMGCERLIAQDRHHYATIASQLAVDIGALARLRSQLREKIRHSPLCDGGRFTPDLKQIYARLRSPEG